MAIQTVVYPLINGTRFDWSSIEISFASSTGVPLSNLPVIGVKELSYKQSLEPGVIYGTAAQVMGHTRGQHKAEGAITFFKSEWGDFLTNLITAGGTGGASTLGSMEIPFDITVNYSEPGPSPIMTDILRGCRIKNVDHSNSQSSEAAVVKCDLSLMYFLDNKVAPIGSKFFQG